jgi:hypothetical protein
MDFEQLIVAINGKLLPNIDRSLTDLEIELLRGAWDNLTYEEIAEASGYSLNYLQRDIGPKFWKLLSQIYGRKLNKTNARAVLTKEAAQVENPSQLVGSALAGSPSTTPENLAGPRVSEPTSQIAAYGSPTNLLLDPAALQSLTPPLQEAAAASIPPPYPTPPPSPIRIDWGDVIDVATFYGRQEELDTLTDWILQGQCRFIALLGAGGIGKSSLAAKLARNLHDQFDCVIWRSLRNAPPLDDLLRDLVEFLSEQEESQAQPERLLYWLRQNRCLLVLDNAETILQPGDAAGSYLPGYEGYGYVFRLLGETVHRSCLLLTSREKPPEVSLMEDPAGMVRSQSLRGCAETALMLLESRGLISTDENKQRLCEAYSCSPLAIKIIAASIQTLFSGSIADFLAQQALVFNNLRRLLDQQVERLSALERSISYWLAINRTWTSIATLQ